MKISYRIILINLTILFIIIFGSSAAFLSLMYNVITSQESRHLLNSASALVWAFEKEIEQCEHSFQTFYKNRGRNLNSEIMQTLQRLDFVLNAGVGPLKRPTLYLAKSNIGIPLGKFTMQDFFYTNPNLIVRFFKSETGEEYLYGFEINNSLISTLSTQAHIEVAIFIDNDLLGVSNETVNQNYYYVINNAFRDLSEKNNYDIYSSETETSYFLSTIYNTKETVSQNNKFTFVIFSILNETVLLKSSLRNILILVIIVSVILSVILTYVITGNLRRQISILTTATEITKTGNFNNRIVITSKDELGDLAMAFNTMLDALETQEKIRTEYTNFISIINSNPGLEELSDKVLKLIIQATGYSVGVLSLIENNKLESIASYGIDPDIMLREQRDDLLKAVIESKEQSIYDFRQKPLKLTAGFISIDIQEIYITPIISGDNVIAILQLGAISTIEQKSKDYIERVKNQFALGLTRALAFRKLENLVLELKELNQEIYNQNQQNLLQNKRLTELHKELSEKAAELEIQKKKAEESTELKSRFLATISHELRTPMNAILGLTELLLEDTELSIKNRERLNVVLRSGRRLLSLINSILDLSRIEAGKMEIVEENFSLNDFLKEIEVTFTPLANAKTIVFLIHKKYKDDVIVRTDKGKVFQIVTNLLGNAVKFTEKGRIELTVSLINTHILKIDVSDTGIGIPKSELSGIFEEFRQVDSSNTRRYGGSGLGLSICKKFTEILHGEISVRSEPGKGSIFTVHLPIKIIPLQTEENIIAVQKEFIDRVVLLINTPQIFLIPLTNHLSDSGYEILTTHGGKKGIELLSKIKPDISITFFPLPDFSITEFISEIHSYQLQVNYTKFFFYFPVGDTSGIFLELGKKVFVGLDASEIEYIIKTKIFPLCNQQLPLQVIYDESVSADFLRGINIIHNEVLKSELLSDLAISNIQKKNYLFICGSLKNNTAQQLNKFFLNVGSAGGTYFIIFLVPSLIDELIRRKEEFTFLFSDEVNEKNIIHILQFFAAMQQSSFKAEPQTETSLEVLNDSEATYGSREAITHNSESVVLIVDDDPDSLFTINEIVKQCGTKTLLAKNGLECLEILEKITPDLILLDIMMPYMDGFQTISRIREKPELRETPVLAITAKAMIEDRMVILKYGFNGYISKPVNSGTLAFKVTQLLVNKQNKYA